MFKIVRLDSKNINGIGLILIAICFCFIHFNASSAQTQLTYLPLILLPFVFLPIKNTIYKSELSVVVFTSIIFITSIISYGVQGDVFTHDFRSHWVYLLSFGVLIVISQSKLKSNYLYFILIFSSVLLTYDVAIEYYFDGVRGYVSHGKPIFFGNIALSTGIIGFILFLEKNNSLLIKGGLLYVAFAGVTASIWSQTRGGWLFLVIFLVLISVSLILNAQNKKTALLKGFSLLIIIGCLFLPFQDDVKSRLNQAYSNLEDYQNGNENTSVGLRLEFWRVSVEQFLSSPLIGSARSGFLETKSDMLEEGRVNPGAKYFKHAHSDIFWTLGTKGLLGVAALYGFYFYLLGFYYKNIRSESTRLYAISGLSVVGGYLIYGLTESFFSMKLGIGYFLIINIILMRLINTSIENKENPVICLGKD